MSQEARRPSQPAWRRYLTFWGADVKADVDEELSFHIEMLQREFVAAGMEPGEARRAAMQRFGDYSNVEDECRTIGLETERMIRRSERFDTLLQDLRYGVRQLRANPMLSLAAIVTLALGVGANTAIFSVVHSVLLQRMPYADADRMVIVWETWRDMDGRASPGHFTEWQSRSASFDALAAFDGSTFNLADRSAEPERLYGARVTPSFFQTGAMTPQHGRYFAADETEPGRDHVVVLSYPLWERRFASDPGIIGQQIRLNSEQYTVIGVTPPTYTLTSLDETLWVPLGFTPEQRSNYGAHSLTIFGKLKPTVSRDRAQEDLQRITAEINARTPDNSGRGVRIADFREVLVGGYRQQLMILLAAVGFVLLLAVVNIANLLLSRARIRRKEVSIRAALGAGRSRILRQLLTESLVLASLGGAAGLLVAKLMLEFLTKMGPAYVPRLEQAGLNPIVLGFAFVVAIASGLLFGAVPAFQVSRVDLQQTLRQGGRGAMGATRDRLRAALVVGELAVALMLLVGAGLLVRSSILLQRVAPGFDARDVLTAGLSLPEADYREPPRIEQAYHDVMERVRKLPGVQGAAAVSNLPLGSGSTDVGLRVEGKLFAPGEMATAHFRIVTPNYHQVMRIPILRGRALQETDDGAGQRVVVINETLAQQLWPNESALGRRISCCSKEPVWREVVGVAGNVRHNGLNQQPRPEMYLPYQQVPPQSWNWFDRSLTLVVRAANPATLGTTIRRAIWSVDRTLPVYRVETLASIIATSTAQLRFNTTLLTALGITGLLLAVVGIYGVISFFVSQRVQEIGIRMALGATARDIRILVLKQGLIMATCGVIIGLLAAFVATRVLQSLLFGVGTTDAVAIGAGTVVLFGAAMIASYLPTRRALRIDPLTSMRQI